MKIITQTYNRSHIVYFLKELSAVGKAIISVEEFDCRIEHRMLDEGKPAIVVLDRHGRVRPDPTRYLTNTRDILPVGSRQQMARALQLLYVFCDLNGYDPKALSFEKVDEFIAFLLGASVQDEPGHPRRTIRSAKTVNAYYGMVKRYVRTMGWPMEAYSHYHEVKVSGPMGAEYAMERTVKKDDHTLKAGTVTEKEIPKHVTPKQMKAMAKNMKEAGDRTSLLVSHLQYSYGLRCGEVLGLTEEDFYIEDEGDGPIYKMVLRNRISDRLDQSCKGLMHPFDPKQYQGSHYKGSRHIIEITRATYDRVQEYIRWVRHTWKMTARQRENYEKDTEADCVYIPQHPNRYIFVGSNGRRLSCQTWNNRLAWYFTQIGIELDYGCKRFNCSHRLRHGFAMFHAQYSAHPMNIFELQRALRHASPNTCAIYYSILPEDERKLKESFQAELEELIPEFYI